MKTYYHDRIAELAGPRYDPRHIEGYMRLGHSTLDGLSAFEFGQEVGLCKQCVDYEGTEQAELNALSFGL